MSEDVLIDVFREIEGSRDDMVEFLGRIIEIPALSPLSDGDGEDRKAALVEQYLRGMGFDEIEHFDAPDDRVPSGKRPNFIAWLRGDGSGKRLMIVTHVDIVPPGDMNKWETDPYQAVVKDGKLYGRGVEDNGQSLAASLFAAKALMELGLRPTCDVGLVFVADEETGSDKGIVHLLGEGVFRKDDLIVVPDGGDPEGRLIEVSEKSIMWVKVETKGQQCHASMPDLGNNAHRAAMRFGCLVDEALHKRFDLRDETFDRPTSTFEPTQKEPNVPNVNTIPGDDAFYFDCRVLPQYKTSDVLEEMRAVADRVEQETDTTIELSTVQHEVAAPPTSPDAAVVKRLMWAVDLVYGNDPFPGGIGGGTCAAIFRRAGYQAAVWQKIDDTCHMPNEYTILDNLVNDCKVFAALYLAKC